MAARANSVDSYIDMAGEYFKKLPSLPKNAQEVLVSIAPWIALVFGALGLIGSVVGLGLFTFLAPLAVFAGARETGAGIIVVLLGLVSSVLLLMAFPGTKNKQSRGWKFLYYSEVVSLVSNIVTLSIVGVLFTLVGFYFLYQIRSYFK